MKRGVKHQIAPYLSAVNVQKLKLRKDIILRLCSKPYTVILAYTNNSRSLLLSVFHDYKMFKHHLSQAIWTVLYMI